MEMRDGRWHLGEVEESCERVKDNGLKSKRLGGLAF